MLDPIGKNGPGHTRRKGEMGKTCSETKSIFCLIHLRYRLAHPTYVSWIEIECHPLPVFLLSSMMVLISKYVAFIAVRCWGGKKGSILSIFVRMGGMILYLMFSSKNSMSSTNVKTTPSFSSLIFSFAYVKLNGTNETIPFDTDVSRHHRWPKLASGISWIWPCCVPCEQLAIFRELWLTWKWRMLGEREDPAPSNFCESGVSEGFPLESTPWVRDLQPEHLDSSA